MAAPTASGDFAREAFVGNEWAEQIERARERGDRLEKELMAARATVVTLAAELTPSPAYEADPQSGRGDAADLRSAMRDDVADLISKGDFATALAIEFARTEAIREDLKSEQARIGAYTTRADAIETSIARGNAGSSRLSVRGDTCLGTPVLYLGGSLDLAVKTEIQAAVSLWARQAERLILDLDEATFIDSSALGVFVGLDVELTGRGGALAIVVAQPDLLRFFDTARLRSLLHIFADSEQALVYLHGDSRS